MPVCPKCRTTFMYTADHVCEGRDYTRLWSGASVAVGALLGGPLGYLYGLSIIRQACDAPGAGNLCGLAAFSTIPVYVICGAAIGGLVATVAVVVIIHRRKA
jgi:hypothetical protein